LLTGIVAVWPNAEQTGILLTVAAGVAVASLYGRTVNRRWQIPLACPLLHLELKKQLSK